LETNPASGVRGEQPTLDRQSHDAAEDGADSTSASSGAETMVPVVPRADFLVLHAMAVASLAQCQQAIADFFAALDGSRPGARRRGGPNPAALSPVESKAPEIAAFLGAAQELLASVCDPDQSRTASQREAGTRPEAAQDDEFTQRFDRLTPRQKRVFRLVARGLPNKVIAHQLGIAETTVKAHVSVILRALGVYSRVRAIALAYKSRFEARKDAFL